METAWFALAMLAFAVGWLAERLIPDWRRGLRLMLAPLILAWATVMTVLWHLSPVYPTMAFVFAVAFGWSWVRASAMAVLERNPR